MKCSFHSSIAKAVFVGAAAAAACASSAFAAGSAIVVEHDPGYRSHTYVMGGPPAYAYDSREYDATPHHRHCRAPAWEPNARYMPGDTVARNGELYVARGISSRVYNVNSPPEWTPNYWAPAHC